MLKQSKIIMITIITIQGAFLFITYASTISEVIQPTLEINGYADDHSIRKPFKPGNINCNTEYDTTAIMEESMLKVKGWMDAVRLKLNESNTEFIYFGSRQQHKNAPLTKSTLMVKPFKEVTQLNI